MEGSDYDFLCKYGRDLRKQKRKFGCLSRSGATMRKTPISKRYIHHGGRKNECAILKHISTTDEWNAKNIEDTFEFDDGGMAPFGKTKVPHRRGPGVYAPMVTGRWGTDFGPAVLYSMNKKKRWLLPDLLQNEIDETVDRENEEEAVIDVIKVEREIASFAAETKGFSFKRVPDTTSVSSTVKSRDETGPRMSIRKPKRGKYAWSTDLLGLSSRPKRNVNSEDIVIPAAELKPQVTYEICRPRPRGSYPNLQHGLDYLRVDNKPRRRAKKELKILSRETNDATVSGVRRHHDTIPPEDRAMDFEEPEAENKSVCMASWFNAIEKSRPPKIRERQRKHSNNSSGPESHRSMKGHVLYETITKKVDDKENNDRNVAELAAAAKFLERIVKNEDASSAIVHVSTASLCSIDGDLPAWGKAGDSLPVKLYGVNIVRGQSRPVKYSCEMPCMKSRNQADQDRVSAFLTLESVCDPSSCKNGQYCYSCETFCICNETIPVRVKTIILSEDPSYQAVAKSWAEKLKEILVRESIGKKCIGAQQIIQIAKSLYATKMKERMSLQDTANRLQSPSKARSLRPTAVTYARKVKSEAAALVGISSCEVTPTTSNEVSCEETNNNDEKEVDPLLDDYELIINYLPLDFCEICCATLSEKGKAYRASALTSCNHRFCTDCWIQHVGYGARQVTALTIICPAFDCTAQVDDVTLMTLLPGDVIRRHQRRKCENLVSLSREFHSCPSCKKLLKIDSSDSSKSKQNEHSRRQCLPLSCECGARWCSQCKGDPHWPATCRSAALYRKEVEKIRVFDVSGLITSVSGRRCPDCSEPMEKNGGCQMMTCICGSTFCWNCLRPFNLCLYNCRSSSASLETWDISVQGSKFGEAVRMAMGDYDCYQSYRNHKTRMNLCRKSASQRTCNKSTGEVTFTEKLEVYTDTERQFQDTLLLCDSLHHIMQYVVVAIGCHQTENKTQRAKMNRFLNRIRLVTSSMERTIFSWNPILNKRTHLEQHLEKQATAARQLVQFLRLFVRRFNIDMNNN